MGNTISNSNATPIPLHAKIYIPLTDLLYVLEGVVCAVCQDAHHGCAASEWLEVIDKEPTPVPQSDAVGKVEPTSVTHGDAIDKVELALLLQGDAKNQDGVAAEPEESSSVRDFQDWIKLIEKPNPDIIVYRLACLTLAVAALRTVSRAEGRIRMTPADLDDIWKLVETGLSVSRGGPELGTAMRDSRGYVAVAICSFAKHNAIGELFRLQLWLPDGLRGARGFEIHAHQTFTQSWILGGSITDRRYQGEDVQDPREANHAKFAITWADGKKLSKHPKLRATSWLTNTGQVVKASPGISRTAGRNGLFCIEAGVYHHPEVAHDQSLATLVYFDRKRGSVADTKTLGPLTCSSVMMSTEPDRLTPSEVVAAVKALREAEDQKRADAKLEWEKRRIADYQRRLEVKACADERCEVEANRIECEPEDSDGDSMRQRRNEFMQQNQSGNSGQFHGMNLHRQLERKEETNIKREPSPEL